MPALASLADDNDYVRLHITPLDDHLVNIILPASVRPSSRNLSLHTIQAFPEKRYGFVDLPRMDAAKLKRKLNGSLLKGTTVRVQDARPEARTTEPSHDAAPPEKKRKLSSSPGKRDLNVLDGMTLKDRKVKRGWTEAAGAKRRSAKDKDDDARKRTKSRYTNQEECLLKVKVPPKAMGNLPGCKKKGKRPREVTVHEFENTTKFPSFLKSSAPDKDGKMTAEFVEGKGWVDEEGNVVETVRARTARAPETGASVAQTEQDSINSVPSTDDESTSSSSESEDDEQSSAPESTGRRQHQDTSAPAIEEATTDASNPPSSLPGSPRSLTIQIPKRKSESSVHPLEALYKRSDQDADATNKTSQRPPEPFSFFGRGSDDEDATPEAATETGNPANLKPPMTPYSRHDFERRSVRSAAPTPDTAHPSRKNLLWGEEEEEEEEGGEEGEDGGEEEETTREAAASQPGQSDFQTWFWENRRELNRSWMTRRKTAAKEKRHRENKARGPRGG
ncbi:hypothetical protein L249_2623 [Ophiocordyceps polyrhachis-furcata BCC 54312]|uniref:RRM domain-containing protein n=1 Tax=Ophiocordyceps polyrhachis-furcata BCC 54312 TaxID=1330021 RepID=A0A367LPM7_9HYPO|nr:hypothetical protein L249_2623 [Ophiocordyceps polyrhachis-furcata BCC 54312]